jgi:roadblock/LC7 domain-containing protein
MGYDLYFINETKKEILSSKLTDTTGLDFAPHIAWYLSRCKGDTLRIAGNEDAFVERELLSASPVYKYVSLENFYPQ